MPPPNLEGFGMTPRKKTLTEIVKEEFARFDAQIQSITGRQTATDTQMAETATRLDRHRDQIGLLNQKMPKIRQKITDLRNSMTQPHE
jgi:chromosome segregation ATPase